jgi:hypothetical protein
VETDARKDSARGSRRTLGICMTSRAQLQLAWVMFALVIAAALMVGEFGTRYGLGVGTVLGFGALSLIPGLWVLARSNFTTASVILVTLGVAVSQWRTIQMLYLVTSWNAHGFAR